MRGRSPSNDHSVTFVGTHAESERGTTSPVRGSAAAGASDTSPSVGDALWLIGATANGNSVAKRLEALCRDSMPASRDRP